MLGGVMTADDKRWQAESDARTLAEADVIKQDKPRLDAAATAAQRMAEKQREEAAAMSRVAKKKPAQTSTGSTDPVSTGKTSTKKKKQNTFNVFSRL